MTHIEEAKQTHNLGYDHSNEDPARPKINK